MFHKCLDIVIQMWLYEKPLNAHSSFVSGEKETMTFFAAHFEEQLKLYKKQVCACVIPCMRRSCYKCHHHSLPPTCGCIDLNVLTVVLVTTYCVVTVIHHPIFKYSL